MQELDFRSFAINILNNDLTPLLHITIDISYFIGLCLIIAGLTRLHRHAQGQQTMFRVAPMATAMYFLSGMVLISFMPHLQMLSNSLFNANTVLMQQCNGGLLSNFYTSSNNFCPMYAYSTDIKNAAPEDQINAAIKYLAFGTLVFVGIISFIRGMVQLVRIGEGQGQATTSKALTHIFAGLIAVNADSVYYLFQNILSSAGAPVA